MPFYIIAILATVGTGIALWFVSIGAFVGYAIGITTGIALIVAVVQNLGRKARVSRVCLSLFRKLTKYHATVYNIHVVGEHEASARKVIYDDALQYADLLDILKGQMKIPTSAAKDAAKHALATGKNTTFEEKVRVALQYYGGGNKNES